MFCETRPRQLLSVRKSNYDKFPFVAVTEAIHPCVSGWDKIAAELQRAIGRGRVEKPILVVDCYPGVDELAVLNELNSRLVPKLAIHAADAYHPPEKIDKLVAPFLGDKDSAFGRFSGLSLVNFFNAEPLWRFRRSIDELKEGLVLIVGCGASLIAWGHILVYADLARRAAQQRFGGSETGNFGADNKMAAANLKYKRAFFVDWRVADRWKRPLIRRWDYVLDTNNPGEPKLADAGDVRTGMREAVTRPFRLAPFFDPARWDGQWAEEASDLKRNAKHVDWCFDCVPEADSLLLGFGGTRFEIPAMDLMYYQPRALMGESVHLRFGDAFPIRSAVLDPPDAKDSRFQVHPLAGHVRQNFRAGCAQDENDYPPKDHLLHHMEPIASGDGWREEKIDLDERNFIETRRHWFTKKVLHATNGGINVLHLVEGDEAVVESPTDAFAPFVVHYAETFIVPAAVGEYTIRPHGPSVGKECATMKAFVRTNAWA
jgi:hypothetical protein